MFDKLKQLKQMKDLQDAAKKEKVEVDREGVKVVVNGAMQIEEVKLNSQISVEDQERILKQNINDALRSAQLSLAQKFSGFLK